MKKMMIIAMSAIMMAACSSDNENNGARPHGDGNGDNGGQTVELQISGGILAEIAKAQTRAANSAWEASDAIGIYAVATGGTTAITGGENVSYTASEAAETNGTSYTSFSATSGTSIALPNDGSAIDVYGYYPYTASVTPAGQAISVATQTSQKAIDWMTTNVTNKTTQDGSTTITKANPSCQLLFAHSLCKLQLNLVHGSGLTATDITTSPSVSIAGLPTTATLNLYTGAVSSQGTPAAIAPVQMGTAETNYDASFEAIILPYTTAAAHAVTLTLNGKNYAFNIASGKTFAAGNKYTYNVTVNAAGLAISAAITPWDNGGSENVTAQ